MRLSTTGMRHAQSIITLKLVLISRPTDSRRLSWPGWLVAYQGGLPAWRWSLVPVLSGPDLRVTSMMCLMLLLLRQTTTSGPGFVLSSSTIRFLMEWVLIHLH